MLRDAQFFCQHHGIRRDTAGVITGIRVAQFNSLSENRDGIEEKVALFAEELGAFEAGGNIGGESIGQMQIFGREGFLPRAAIQMQDA